ncbi:MAG TPA: endo-1,4-beta-xylanase [Candidatus Saccharimonadales bacterium]
MRRFLTRFGRRFRPAGIAAWPAGLAGIAVCIILAPAAFGPQPATVRYDLLRNRDWSDFAGADRTPDGVVITALDRKIVNQDGSGGQPNPPVNLAGPAVSFRRGLTITAAMHNFRPGDELQLYGGVPIIYDEWRFEPPSVQITLVNQAVRVSVWDGTSANPAEVKQFVFTDRNLATLAVTQSGSSLKITANSKKLGTVNARTIFAADKLWIGADAAKGNIPWTLSGLAVRGPAGSLQVNDGLSWNKPPAAGKTLQSLAAARPRPILIGAAVALNPLLTNSRYRTLALEQFGVWTPENELKPQFIHPQPGVYSFKDADLLVNTALRNGIAVHGHTLVFGEANPRWMQSAPPADRQQIMVDHITAVMTHFKGRIHEWDVLDEPLSDNDGDYANGGDGLRHHIWYQAMGKDYVAIALRAAHAADPSAKLYINDYGLEADGERWTALLQLIGQLQSQGVPLDGIGFEAHVYEAGDHIDPAVLERHMAQLSALGLTSRISEIDVHGENSQYQAAEYAGVLKACLDQAGCTAFSTWGITDRYGSTTDTGVYPLSYGNDLIWNIGLQPKPAYPKLMQLLQSGSPAP